MPDEEPLAPAGRRGGPWRAVGWGLTGCWAAVWLVGAIGAGTDPTNSTPLLGGIALAIGLGVVPVLPLWVRWFRQGRDEAARRRRAQEVFARQEHRAAEQRRLADLPDHLRDEWRRLEHAHDLVERFAREGWVDRGAVAEVGDQVARLERLLAADRATDELGGRRSTSLEQQVRDLTGLLVALADEAVEHQATLTSDHPVPATLAAARDRLAATRQAYRDLPSPGSRQEPRQYP